MSVWPILCSFMFYLKPVFIISYNTGLFKCGVTGILQILVDQASRQQAAIDELSNQVSKQQATIDELVSNQVFSQVSKQQASTMNGFINKEQLSTMNQAADQVSRQQVTTNQHTAISKVSKEQTSKGRTSKSQLLSKLKASQKSGKSKVQITKTPNRSRDKKDKSSNTKTSKGRRKVTGGKKSQASKPDKVLPKPKLDEPSPSVDKTSGLLTVNEVLSKFPSLVRKKRIINLCGKIAQCSVIGKDILLKCTVNGKTLPPIPVKYLDTLKQTLLDIFPEYKTKQDDFEIIWKGCLRAIGKICTKLRSEKKP